MNDTLRTMNMRTTNATDATGFLNENLEILAVPNAAQVSPEELARELASQPEMRDIWFDQLNITPSLGLGGIAVSSFFEDKSPLDQVRGFRAILDRVFKERSSSVGFIFCLTPNEMSELQEFRSAVAS